MYGFHDKATAERIAAEKTAETGRTHVVLPAELADGPPGQWTIGAEIKALSGAEFMASLKKKFGGTDGN